MEFTTGISELDEMYPNLLKRKFFAVIAGLPGTGKTTLASAICIANMKNGKKCIYFSFFEDKQKFYDIMKELGLDFESFEKKGLFQYIKVPITKDIDQLLDEIARMITEKQPHIIVIDSINALMHYIEHIDQRAILHNFLSALPNLINGLVISILELNGERYFREIEYIADIYIELSCEEDRGFVTRHMKIKKARGTSTRLVKIPFTIGHPSGYIVLIPETPKKIKAPSKKYYGITTLFNKYLAPIHAGDVILGLYLPDARLIEWVVFVLDLLFKNDLNVLFLSYRYSPEEAKGILRRLLTSLLNVDEELVMSIMDKYIRWESINPYAFSLTELALKEKEIIQKYNPDMIYFHGMEIMHPIISRDPVHYYHLLTNQLLSFKKKGIIVIRSKACIHEIDCKRMSSLSDVVIRTYPPEKPGEKGILYIWRKGEAPVKLILTEDILSRTSIELSGFLKSKLYGRDSSNGN